MFQINSQKIEKLFPSQFWVYSISGVYLLDECEHDHELKLTEIGYKGRDCDEMDVWVIEFTDNDNDKIKATFYNENVFNAAQEILTKNGE